MLKYKIPQIVTLTHFVSEGTLSADPKFLFFFFLKTFFYTFFEFENVYR